MPTFGPRFAFFQAIPNWHQKLNLTVKGLLVTPLH